MSLSGRGCVAKEGDFAAFYHNPAGTSAFEYTAIGDNLRLLDTTGVNIQDSGGRHSIDGTNTEGQVAMAPTWAFYMPDPGSLSAPPPIDELCCE